MSDLPTLFAVLNRRTVAPPDLAGLRVPQRRVWRHVVDGYEYRESVGEDGRLVGTRWAALAECTNQPAFIQTSMSEQEARQAGVLLESGGAQAGAALAYLRHTVPLAPGNVLYVRIGSMAGTLYEVVTLAEMRDLFAREAVWGVRRVADVPAEVRR